MSFRGIHLDATPEELPAEFLHFVKNASWDEVQGFPVNGKGTKELFDLQQKWFLGWQALDERLVIFTCDNVTRQAPLQQEVKTKEQEIVFSLAPDEVYELEIENLLGYNGLSFHVVGINPQGSFTGTLISGVVDNLQTKSFHFGAKEALSGFKIIAESNTPHYELKLYKGLNENPGQVWLFQRGALELFYQTPMGHAAGDSIKDIHLFYNEEGDMVCLFNDQRQVPSMLNLDEDPYRQQLSLFPQLQVPQFSLEAVEENGHLESGSYFLAFAYSHKGLESNYCLMQGPIHISRIRTDSSRTAIWEKAESGPTNKSIRFKLNNADLRYEAVQPVVLYFRNGSVEQWKLPLLANKEGVVQYSLTGREQRLPITLEEILQDSVSYDRVSTFALVNNQLLGGNVSRLQFPDYQAWANEIVVKPVLGSVALDVVKGSHADAKSLYDETSFMPGEVYAFFMRWVLKDGSRSAAFHLPGPQVPIASREVISTKAGSMESWKARSTGELNRRVDTGGEISEFNSKMGAWENQDEFYPADFPKLSGRRVRHHRMPDISSGMWVYGASAKYRPLFNLNWDSIQDRDYYSTEIVYAEDEFLRQEGTALVAKKACNMRTYFDYSFVWRKGNTWPERREARFNIKIAIERTDGVEQVLYERQWHKNTQGKQDVYINLPPTEHRFGLALGDKIRITIAVYFEDMISENLHRFGYTFRGHVAEGTGQSLRSPVLGVKLQNVQLPPHLEPLVQGYELLYARRDEQGVFGSALGLPDVFPDRPNDALRYQHGIGRMRLYHFESLLDERVKGGNIIRGAVGYDGKDLLNEAFGSVYTDGTINSISDAQYLPADNSATVPKNKNREATLSANLAEAPLIANREKFWTFMLEELLPNRYMPFSNQPLVNCGRMEGADVVNSRVFFGGDAYVGLQGQHITFAKESSTGTTGEEIHFNLPVWSSINVNLRARGSAWNETFYPLSGNQWESLIPDEIRDVDNNGVPDYRMWDIHDHYAYNKDFSRQLDLKGGFSLQPPKTEHYANRIIRSGQMNAVSQYHALRRFLPADYYETEQLRGPIIRLEAQGERVIIHQSKGLFLSQSQIEFNSSLETLAVGSGDLFRLQPQEVLPSGKGFAGLQDIQHALYCPAGYCFWENGKLWQLGESLELLNEGINTYIRDASFHSLGYDPREKVLILTVARGEILLSFGYRFGSKAWASVYGYYPDHCTWTDQQYYSMWDNKGWLHHEGERQIFYGQLQPFIVSQVQRPASKSFMRGIWWKDSGSKGRFMQLEAITETGYSGINDLRYSRESLYIPQPVSRDKELWRYTGLKNLKLIQSEYWQGAIEKDFQLDEKDLSLLPWWEVQHLSGRYFILRFTHLGSERIIFQGSGIDTTPYSQ